jgi:hypothetical protein
MESLGLKSRHPLYSPSPSINSGQYRNWGHITFYMRTALFRAVTQRVVTIPYWRCGTSRFHLQGSKVLDSLSCIPKSPLFLRVGHLWTVSEHSQSFSPSLSNASSSAVWYIVSTAKQARRRVRITFAVVARHLLLPRGIACYWNRLLQEYQQNELFCCFNVVRTALLCFVFNTLTL